jgi:deoxyribonuclease V
VPEARARRRLPLAHGWDVSVAEAQAIQRHLRPHLRLVDAGTPIRVVAGVDCAYDRAGRRAFAAVLAFRLPALTLVDAATASVRAAFPYVPGLLSFREGPAILAAVGRLAARPDLFLFDGQGIAHPRGLGLAAHLGLLLDRPSIGCAKSLLVGEVDLDRLGRRRGSRRPIRLEGRTVGFALRTRDGGRPIFVSPGHRVSLDGAVRLVLRCCRGARLPEPTRLADRAVAQLREGEMRRGETGRRGLPGERVPGKSDPPPRGAGRGRSRGA